MSTRPWCEAMTSGRVLPALARIARRGAHGACALAPVLALAGCATFHDRPVTAASSAASLQQRSLAAPDLKRDLARHGVDVSRWPLPQWTLDDLILAARHDHPDLAIARDRWHKARAAVRTARAYPNPSLDVTPRYTTNAKPGESPWTIDAAAAFTLITAGKRSDRIAAARADAAAAQYDFVHAQWTTDAGVRRAWLDLAAARRRLPLLVGRVHDARAALEAVEIAVNAGQSPPFEAFAARRAWNRAVDARDAGQTALAQARQALASAVGVPRAALAAVRLAPDADAASPPPLPADARLQTWVLTQRADVRAAVLRYAASQSRLKLAIARQYPDVTLGPGYEWDQGAHRWSLGLSLTLPVFNHNQGPIAEARAQRALRTDQLRALQLKLVTRLHDALAAWRSAQRAQSLARQRVHDSRRRERDDHAALLAGQIARTTWLRDRLTLAQDRLDLIDARTRLRRARLRIASLIEHPLAPGAAPPARRGGTSPNLQETSP